MVVAGVLISLFTLATTLSAYRDARSALHDGRAAVVEGAIENFHPMPRAGHDNERFDVGSRHFEYSDYDITPGFNTAQSQGGPIHAGEYVRVTYYKSEILKLEIREGGR